MSAPSDESSGSESDDPSDLSWEAENRRDEKHRQKKLKKAVEKMKGKKKYRIKYPWGTLDIKRTKAQAKKKDANYYHEIQTKLQKENHTLNVFATMFASIVDTKCVDTVTMFAGVITHIWLSSRTKRHFVECIETTSEEQVPIIPIDLSLVVTDTSSNLDIDYHLHANALVIDRKLKTVERFEPNTGAPVEDEDEASDFDDQALEAFFKKELGEEWTYIPSAEFCIIGPQAITQDSMCWSWSLYYMHLRLLNPGVPRDAIIDRLVLQSQMAYSPVYDWLDLVKDSTDAWLTKNGSYNDKQIAEFQAMRKLFDSYEPVDMIKDLRYIAVTNPKPYDEFFDLFLHGETEVNGYYTIKADHGTYTITADNKPEYKQIFTFGK